MKKYFPILGVVLVAISAPAQTQPAVTGSVQPLTLQEAVRIALGKNPGIQAADAYARAVQESITAARSFRYPRMGLPEDAPTPIRGSLSEASFFAGSLEDRQARALAVRPDYLQGRLGRQQAANGMRMARAEFLPKVNLFSSWEADNQTFATRGGNNWAVGATLNFNLFDGVRMVKLRSRELEGSEVEGREFDFSTP